jgi:hypothetical protein
LRQPIGVPVARHIATRLEAHDRVAVARLNLKEDLLADVLEIGCLTLVGIGGRR